MAANLITNSVHQPNVRAAQKTSICMSNVTNSADVRAELPAAAAAAAV